MAKEFVISDESILNDYGFRVMTSGIKLEQFNKNPLCLFMHSRPNKWDLKKDSVLAIGTWENLRIEDGKLIGTPVFDQDDEFAVKIMNKVEKGIYKMCSPGLNAITTSSDEKYLLPGQKYETLVESLLLEISIADFGSNFNALTLYKRDNEDYIALSSDQTKESIPEITKTETEETGEPKSKPTMKKIAIVLGMSEDSTEEQMVEAITQIKNSEASLKGQVEAVQLSSITSAVESAIAEKRITADKKEQMITLGKAVGIDSLKSTLDLMRPVTKPTDHIKGEKAEGEGTITLASLMKEGVKAVELFKAENPEEYASLYKEHYGVEYIKPLED